MRSTSGITCWNFFCSVVFSMPVCRYPIVGAADTMVSPSSSSTRRSTPCVLGCCGPMLTVIVSLRISAIAVYLPLDEIAHRVNQRAMHFLDPRREVVRDIHVQICRRADDAAVAAGEGDGFQPP